MASILSHPAVPLGLTVALGTAAIPPRLAALGVLCSMLPDLDSIGFFAGIPYGDLLGHRGLSHSLACALVAAGLAVPLSQRLGATRRAAFLFVLASTLSHGVLDAMTTGGLGVAFLSPFSNRRWFLPWRVIEVSPIGVSAFLSDWGVRVLASELRWIWAPIGTAALAIGVVRRWWAARGALE